MIGGRSLNGGLGGQDVDHTSPPIRPQASLDLAGLWKMAVAFRKVCTLDAWKIRSLCFQLLTSMVASQDGFGYITCAAFAYSACPRSAVFVAETKI